jgi:L,D-transpeptidase YcbB
MKHLLQYAAILLVLLSGRSSGQSGKDDLPAPACETLIAANLDDPATAVRSELCFLVRKAAQTAARPVAARLQNQTLKFYLPYEFQPAWTENGRLTSQARALIQALKDADQRGLQPEDYAGPKWEARVAMLDIAGPPSADVLAEFDFALTTAALAYLSDLHNGRVSPANLLFNLDSKNKQFDAAEFLRERVLHAADMNAALEQVEPDFAGYRRTLKALQDYLTLAAAGEGEPIPVPSHPLKSGDAYSGTSQLAERLRCLGDLPPDASLPSANKYAGPLVDAVRRFQARHGLEPDGIIGPATLEQLTTPISRRVTQLSLTLERWRWLPDDLKPPLIVVNIPEFQLRAYEGHSASLSMRAIVGNAEGHQTPIFAHKLESVVFHPYWNVPESIQKEELLPILTRDPSYLTKHQMEMVNRRGQPVTGDLRNPAVLEQLRSGNLSLRQRPGPANSLGLLKFSFPNQYSIYIHGTPEKRLFSYFRRDLSHGCIRVEDPAVLAAWVLRDNPQWTPKRIAAAMRSKTSSQVKVPRPIPVFIVYGTAFVEENREVRFFADIYGHDAALELALAARPR